MHHVIPITMTSVVNLRRRTLRSEDKKAIKEGWYRECLAGPLIPPSRPLCRWEERTLVQLWLGQSPLLQSYVHSIGKAPDPRCKSCGKEETARHYLLECPEWAPMRLELLGPDPQPGILRAAQTAVLEYLARTGRLRPSRAMRLRGGRRRRSLCAVAYCKTIYFRTDKFSDN